MPPVKHALLSASSASRWLVCTAAPRFEEGLPESTSEYAEEGRLAHAIGELKVTKKCTPMSTRTYNTRLNKLKKDPLYTPEMDKTTDLYLEHITEQVMAYDTAPTVAVEVQVDFSDYVPEGFGTCDCCIIGGDLLSIVDYKHGKGVPVSAVGNPQMRLYALGALHRYFQRTAPRPWHGGAPRPGGSEPQDAGRHAGRQHRPVRRRDGDRKDLRLPGGGNGIPPMPGRCGPALSPSPDLDLQHRFAERGAQ